MLAARLSNALQAQGSPGDLHRSVRISHASDKSVVDRYGLLIDALGESGAPLLAGWWAGWADEVSALISTPGEEVSLARTSDLEWIIWKMTWPEVTGVMKATRLEPTLLATTQLGWVLFSPPSSDDMFLYPELSASG